MGSAIAIYVYMNDERLSFFCTDYVRKEQMKDEMKQTCLDIVDKYMKPKQEEESNSKPE